MLSGNMGAGLRPRAARDEEGRNVQRVVRREARYSVTARVIGRTSTN
jgi:hypothetical protein